MSRSLSAKVKTYASEEKLVIQLSQPATSKQAKAAIGEKLGLKPKSLPLFGISIGPLDRPSKILKDTDPVPQGADLSFHKWCFDLKKEEKLSLQDDAAMHLIFCEARFNYDHQRFKFDISPTQEMELESFLDPAFTVERQFVECLRTVPGYDTYVVHECTVKEDIVGNACNIPSGTSIECHLSSDKFSLRSATPSAVVATTATTAATNVAAAATAHGGGGGGGCGELLVEWSWKVVRRWKMDAVSTILFDVCLEDRNAPIMKWIALESRQSSYLFHLAGGICDMIGERSADKRPAINPALAGKVQDPLREFVNGIFFGQAAKFSSITKIQ